jgi:hypothetical protein
MVKRRQQLPVVIGAVVDAEYRETLGLLLDRVGALCRLGMALGGSSRIGEWLQTDLRA